MTHLKSICLLLSFCLLTTTLQVSAHIIDEPVMDVSLPEQDEIEDRFHFPMVSIYRVLSKADRTCTRLPSEVEFNEFISNGKHRSIRCSETIKELNSISRSHNGKEEPILPEFFKRNQLEIHSDTKTLFVILKQKPSEWKYKHFKSEDYEYVIYCIHNLQKCSLRTVKDRVRFCRNSKDWAKSCYFGNKKVIDY